MTGSKESSASYKIFILLLFSLEPIASAHTFDTKDMWLILFLFYIDFRYLKESMFMVRSEFIFCQ